MRATKDMRLDSLPLVECQTDIKSRIDRLPHQYLAVDRFKPDQAIPGLGDQPGKGPLQGVTAYRLCNGDGHFCW